MCSRRGLIPQANISRAHLSYSSTSGPIGMLNNGDSLNCHRYNKRRITAVKAKADKIICVFVNLFITKLMFTLKNLKSKILLYINFNSLEFKI